MPNLSSTGQPLRILHAIPFFTPRMGGSAQVCYQLARHLGQRGHQVTVITSDYGIQDSGFPAGPFQVTFLPNLVARWGFYFSPSLAGWARRNAGQFDVIHLHTFRTFQNAVIRPSALRHKVPLVLSAHGTLPVILERKFPKQVYDVLAGRALLASASRLLAVSNTEAEQYRQAGADPERVRVIYNGLDLEEFGDLPARGAFRSRHGGYPNTKIILFLGRIHKRKGIDHLIRAFSRLQWNSSPALLIIAGPDEGELGNLQRLASQMDLEDKVQFVGPLYGEDKLAAYVDADILASPAEYEIFGLVPFEALLCGAPVVVGDDCGTGELIAQTGVGYAVRFGDLEQLADTLDSVLAHPEEARRRVQKGQGFIRRTLDWNVITAELENVYREVAR